MVAADGGGSVEHMNMNQKWWVMDQGGGTSRRFNEIPEKCFLKLSVHKAVRVQEEGYMSQTQGHDPLQKKISSSTFWRQKMKRRRSRHRGRTGLGIACYMSDTRCEEEGKGKKKVRRVPLGRWPAGNLISSSALLGLLQTQGLL